MLRLVQTHHIAARLLRGLCRGRAVDYLPTRASAFRLAQAPSCKGGGVQTILTGLLLPPMLFIWTALAAGLLAMGGRRWAGAVGAGCALCLLLLATPMAAGVLTVALDRMAPAQPAEGPPAAAIIVLGGEMARGAAGPDVGVLTLERLRAAAILHRRTGLPVLVTGGPLSRGAPPIAELMAASLAADFGVSARWIEPRARDTRDNALLSAELLRADGIEAALVVSQAWHLPRAQAAFARARFPVTPSPVRIGRMPDGQVSDWIPQPNSLAQSWLALREWAGLIVYRIRDGG